MSKETRYVSNGAKVSYVGSAKWKHYFTVSGTVDRPNGGVQTKNAPACRCSLEQWQAGAFFVVWPPRLWHPWSDVVQCVVACLLSMCKRHNAKRLENMYR